ncbi:hypothetical protein JTB14_025584 [Gonioctena quinquepunctata]|nr:hypothetical protein JTB14_025584 [Gonioctena quinquepunctata]
MSYTLPHPFRFPAPARYPPLASFDSNNSADEMFKHISNCDQAMVAFCLEEDEGHRKSSMANSGKCRFWVHAAWKKRSIEFTTLSPHLLDEDTKFHQYFRMSFVV